MIIVSILYFRYIKYETAASEFLSVICIYRDFIGLPLLSAKMLPWPLNENNIYEYSGRWGHCCYCVFTFNSFLIHNFIYIKHKHLKFSNKWRFSTLDNFSFEVHWTKNQFPLRHFSFGLFGQGSSFDPSDHLARVNSLPGRQLSRKYRLAERRAIKDDLGQRLGT